MAEPKSRGLDWREVEAEAPRVRRRWMVDSDFPGELLAAWLVVVAVAAIILAAIATAYCSSWNKHCDVGQLIPDARHASPLYGAAGGR